MKSVLPVTMALMFASFAFGCEEAGNEPGIDGIEQGAEPQALPVGSASGYYSLTRDMRKCMYPMCGGYYLTSVNQNKMRCVDGALQKSCYVADADFSAIKLPGSDFDALFSRSNSKLVVFHGTVESNVIEGRGNYGRLVADKVYSAVTDKLPSTYEPIYFAMDNGIRCIKAPCASIDDVKVNTNSAPRSVIDVDFSLVQGATQEQLDAASMALYEAGVLVAGYHEVVRNYYPQRPSKLVAKQIYLPVKASNADPLYCENDADCIMTQYSKPVTSPNQCYCTLCPTHLSNTWTYAEYEAGYLRNCSEFTMGNRCPMPYCQKPQGAPACENNSCVVRPFDGDEF